jgi:Fe2+ transport system protein FeoA
MESLFSYDSYGNFPEKVDSSMHIPLSLCREGDRVLIRKVLGGGGFKNRLVDLGFRKGKELTVIRYAPLRDPMEVLIGDGYVSLRVVEAEQIMVTKLDTPADGQ